MAGSLGDLPPWRVVPRLAQPPLLQELKAEGALTPSGLRRWEGWGQRGSPPDPPHPTAAEINVRPSVLPVRSQGALRPRKPELQPSRGPLVLPDPGTPAPGCHWRQESQGTQVSRDLVEGRAQRVYLLWAP